MEFLGGWRSPVPESGRPLEGTVPRRFRRRFGLPGAEPALVAVLAAVLVLGSPSLAEVAPPSAPTEEPEGLSVAPDGLTNPMGDTSPDSRQLSPSFRLSRVYRGLLEVAIDDPSAGATEVADWQRVVIDFSNGFRLDLESFLRLERARQQSIQSSTRFNPSGVPGRSAREIREARELAGLVCLQKTQLTVARQVADRDPRAMASLAWFHLGAYSRQIRPPAVFWLAPHSRDFVADLAGLHWQATGETELVIALLVELANVQRQANGYDDGLGARALFERVLELDPEHRLARYWAGFLSEKYGRYQRAAHHFERLAEVDPDDTEARLRWAVVRLRLGGRGASTAATTLRQLARDTTGTVPGWMSRVAFGELVRSLGATDPRAAIALAREGLGRFPDESSLHVQVAYHLRLDAWDESLRSLGRAETLRPAENALGARARYDLAREEGFAENVRWLEGEIERGREPLREALDLLEIQWLRLPQTRPEPIEACGFLAHREGVP